MAQELTDLSVSLIGFFQFLRSSGMKVTISEELDAISAASLVDIFNKSEFYFALRTALVKNPTQYGFFDVLFARYWIEHLNAPIELGENSIRRSETALATAGGWTRISDEFRSPVSPDKVREFSLYSPVEILSRQNFRHPKRSELTKTKILLRKLRRRLATKPGRRLTVTTRGVTDLRQTIRRSIKNAGEVLEDVKVSRKKTRSRILLLCDVSGSMLSESDHILRVLYLLHNVVRDSEVFVFSTDLIRLTELCRGRSYEFVARQIATWAPIWGSGTRIGSSLLKLVKLYGHLLDKRTAVIVVSDGWDLGDPKLLCDAMAELRKRTSTIVWLSPLFGHRDYEPTCVGMRTAMPYIDLLSSSDAMKSQSLFHQYLGKSIGGR